MKKQHITVYLGLLLAILFSGCVKDKLNDAITLPGGLNQSNSSVRIYNLYGFDMDVTLNNIPLTPYGTNSGNNYGQAIFNGGFFKDGSSFTVPNALLEKSGKVHVIFTPANIGLSPGSSGSVPATLTRPIDTTLINDPVNPKDYFILANGHLQAIPHSLAAPLKASNFKIRIINLSAEIDTNKVGGPITLTFADGTKVDASTTNIARGVTSSYVELPYGAYEFKLFIANGQNIDITKQLSLIANNNKDIGRGPKPNYLGGQYGNGRPIYLQNRRFSFSKIYQPGGTYTIIISKNICQYQNRNLDPQFILLNSFRVLTETNPPANFTYARLQAVNTLPLAKKVIVKIDGQAIGAAMPFGMHSDYGIFIEGKHQLEADDEQGNVLAQKSITLYANDNITAWIYQNSEQSAISFSSNDMSAVNSNVQLQFRFMNFAPNIPFATFYSKVPPPSRYAGYTLTETNDTLGKPTISIDPFYHFDLTPSAINAGDSLSVALLPIPIPITGVRPLFQTIYAFQSSPGSVPGIFLADVEPVTPYSFIANPALYSTGSLPPGEPGAYTIALIGKEGLPSTDPYKARMLILKHSK